MPVCLFEVASLARECGEKVDGQGYTVGGLFLGPLVAMATRRVTRAGDPLSYCSFTVLRFRVIFLIDIVR